MSGILIYKGYQEYVNPKQIYGNWFEIKVMPDRREVIKFTDKGVYRNSHLVTTKFKYDGKTIRFKAGGEMETIYQLSGTVNSPQLKRIQPDKPVQTLIKKGMKTHSNNQKYSAHRVGYLSGWMMMVVVSR
ncbi:DUF2850 domain-containing protein [Vibrio sp. PP-XX7]